MMDINIDFSFISDWISSHSPEIATALIVAGVVYFLSKSKFLSVIGGILTLVLGVSLL